MTEPTEQKTIDELVEDAHERNLYWTGGAWCDWVEELTIKIEQLEAERDELKQLLALKVAPPMCDFCGQEISATGGE